MHVRLGDGVLALIRMVMARLVLGQPILLTLHVGIVVLFATLNVTQVLTIPRALLAERVRVLSTPLVKQVNDGLRFALDL